MAGPRPGPRNTGMKTKLARVRLEKGWTQAQLAEVVGTSQAHVAGWERGKVTPKADTLLKIAKALDCKMEDIIG